MIQINIAVHVVRMKKIEAIQKEGCRPALPSSSVVCVVAGVSVVLCAEAKEVVVACVEEADVVTAAWVVEEVEAEEVLAVASVLAELLEVAAKLEEVVACELLLVVVEVDKLVPLLAFVLGVVVAIDEEEEVVVAACVLLEEVALTLVEDVEVCEAREELDVVVAWLEETVPNEEEEEELASAAEVVEELETRLVCRNDMLEVRPASSEELVLRNTEATVVEDVSAVVVEKVDAALVEEVADEEEPEEEDAVSVPHIFSGQVPVVAIVVVAAICWRRA